MIMIMDPLKTTVENTDTRMTGEFCEEDWILYD
jgi:hypothetical protein